jgi:hypothetical protein
MIVDGKVLSDEDVRLLQARLRGDVSSLDYIFGDGVSTSVEVRVLSKDGSVLGRMSEAAQLVRADLPAVRRAVLSAVV